MVCMCVCVCVCVDIIVFYGVLGCIRRLNRTKSRPRLRVLMITLLFRWRKIVGDNDTGYNVSNLKKFILQICIFSFCTFDHLDMPDYVRNRQIVTKRTRILSSVRSCGPRLRLRLAQHQLLWQIKSFSLFEPHPTTTY